MSEGITKFFLDNAECDHVIPFLDPAGQTIRIYGHWPTPEISWWKATLPLSKNGKAHKVLVQSLQFDIELSYGDFINWIDEFRQGGITLVQSGEPLPHDFHPRKFKNPSSFENVLKHLGAVVLFELPHRFETAEVTVFSEAHAKRLLENNVNLRPV